MDPISLRVEIIWDNTPKSIWTGSTMEKYRSLGMTNRGEVGERFVRRYLKAHGIETENGGRTSPTDLSIKGNRFEVKTASLGSNGTFQFNHPTIPLPPRPSNLFAPPTNPLRPKESKCLDSASLTEPPPPWNPPTMEDLGQSFFFAPSGLSGSTSPAVAGDGVGDWGVCLSFPNLSLAVSALRVVGPLQSRGAMLKC